MTFVKLFELGNFQRNISILKFQDLGKEVWLHSYGVHSQTREKNK